MCVPCTDLTPEEFHREYVAQRKPVVIDLAGDNTWAKMLTEWQQDTYLEDQAGDERVWLEHRDARLKNTTGEVYVQRRCPLANCRHNVH